MKEIKYMSLKEYLKNPKFGIYIYIYGYATQTALFTSQNMMEGGPDFWDVALNIFNRTNLIDKLFRNNNIDAGKVQCIVKRMTHYHGGFTSILKVDLLDENNNVIDSVKVGESEMPLEFRGKI